jgi:alpha-glucoside transport system permease protein
MNSNKLSNKILVNVVLGIIVLLWLVPVVGILASSFRDRFDIQTTPWWNVLPHRDWVATKTINPRELGLDTTGPMTVEGVTATFEEMRAGIEEGDTRLIWIGTRPIGKIQVQEKQWVTSANLNLDNYRQVMQGKTVEITRADGTVERVPGNDFYGSLLNSLTVTIPATIIPILIAAFAAYGFAWMNFPGRRFWLAHTGFGLPLATYLLFNYIRGLPRETLEAAFIDGASHFTIFTRLILPLSIPALASFAIFQFLWVWNDYLVALIILGPDPNVRVVTMTLASIVGTRGEDWHLLTAGAFISMLIPLIVFFSLQRYFVRGLLAGSVKG